jgi:Ser/Thr protein kinase RdoA (MazF antagonist)
MGNDTKLHNKEIAEILVQNYDIKPINISEINRGTADIFKIETENRKYVLKEFSEGRTKESVIKETDIINFLNGKQIKVPIYVKSKTDNFYIEYGNRIIVLQEFIEGYTMENNTGDYEKTIESAMLLGKMTKALETYEGLTEDGIMEKSFSKKSIQNGIVKMKDLQQKINIDNPYREKFIDDLEFKIKVAEKLEKEFNFKIINKMTIINSHGDFSVQQLIYNDKGEKTIIDFETAKKMPIVWEVMRSYSYVDKEAKDGEFNIDTLIEYFKEFSKYIKLNEYDLKYAPHLYLIHIIASVFGYKQFNENYERKTLLEFALFRTKLCRYLYQHLEEISSRLKEEIK